MLELSEYAFLRRKSQLSDFTEQIGQIDNVLLAIEREAITNKFVDGGLTVRRLLLRQHKNVEFVEAVEVRAVHELPNGRLHLLK